MLMPRACRHLALVQRTVDRQLVEMVLKMVKVGPAMERWARANLRSAAV